MLDNKVVFIAGACGRIGKELSKQCLENKACIIISDMNEENLKLLEKDLGKNSEQILALETDISSKESLNKAINASLKHFSKIDSFVNTTYPYPKHWGKIPYYEASFEQICESLNMHLAAYILAAQEFIKFFKKQGFGNLINLSSIMGFKAPKFENYEGTSMQSPLEYSVIKAGINHLGVWLAKECFKQNIRVNTVSSGGIKDCQSETFLKAYNKSCASKGMLDTSDLCGAILFLLSDLSKNITGQNLIVDDGWSL
ncbi:oxidoreductase [uncultured Campylobacter sp.]|uniref:flagellin modification protein PtmA n=1 Tax=uncultured Campylobacter sp. TaxID=218934 RepID=UPI002620F73E|nr:oxidoreductase [uncultured Campylobacter sp.]